MKPVKLAFTTPDHVMIDGNKVLNPIKGTAPHQGLDLGDKVLVLYLCRNPKPEEYLPNSNIIAFDRQGKILWRAQGICEVDPNNIFSRQPYFGLGFDEELNEVWGQGHTRAVFDLETGKIVRKYGEFR
jgi:hypothetical protein